MRLIGLILGILITILGILLGNPFGQGFCILIGPILVASMLFLWIIDASNDAEDDRH